MNIEAQVCALEYAKKLKELGIEQISLFYWAKAKGINAYGLSYLSNMFSLDEKHYDELYAAFTVAELGRLIPFTIKLTIDNEIYTGYCTQFVGHTEHDYTPTISYYYDLHEHYQDQGIDPLEVIAIDFADENEANARAKMLIHLIENKLI